MAHSLLGVLGAETEAKAAWCARRPFWLVWALHAAQSGLGTPALGLL